MTEPPLSSDAAHNRLRWDAQADEYQARHAAQLEASGGTAWGVWQIPESHLHVLGEVRGRDVLELGCGAAQWSIALARQGANMTGLDVSEKQLEHARELMARTGVSFPLVPSDGLAVDYWDLHRIVVPDEPLLYQLPYGEWIRLFREHDLVIESLLELRPPADASSSYRDSTDREWARRWPMEHIWRVRKGRG